MSKEPEKYLYGGYVRTLSERVSGEFNKIAAIHNFEFGTEFEIALCIILRDVLPEKYGVCRGHVVTASGETAGDDIIIYDKSNFPTLKIRGAHEFLRKEHVPVEAVCAYIEAKHTLLFGDAKKPNLDKAIEQIAAVRNICAGRFSSRFNPKPEKDSPFCMIFARSFNNTDKNKADIKLAIEQLKEKKILYPGPDVIVAGDDFLTSPKVDIEGGGSIIFDFISHAISDGGWCYPNKIDGVAFGCALLKLLKALDQIKLTQPNWQRVVFNAMDPEHFDVYSSTKIADAISEIRSASHGIHGFEAQLDAEYDKLLNDYDDQTIAEVLRHEQGKPVGPIKPLEANQALLDGNIKEAVKLVINHRKNIFKLG